MEKVFRINWCHALTFVEHPNDTVLDQIPSVGCECTLLKKMKIEVKCHRLFILACAHEDGMRTLGMGKCGYVLLCRMFIYSPRKNKVIQLFAATNMCANISHICESRLFLQVDVFNSSVFHLPLTFCAASSDNRARDDSDKLYLIINAA